MGLNYIHEAAHSVYLKHVHNGTIAETFLGNELFASNPKPYTMGQAGHGSNLAGERGGEGRCGDNIYNVGSQHHNR